MDNLDDLHLAGNIDAEEGATGKTDQCGTCYPLPLSNLQDQNRPAQGISP
jgi:hypothetical protein